MHQNTPYLNLSSYPGGGKTTITKLLLSRFRSILIPKPTTRPKRPTEEIPEYDFISMMDFLQREEGGEFIGVETIIRYGETHYHAIPKVEFWPTIPNNTELILSVFGTEAPLVKKYVPNMKLCFIDFHNKDILIQRLWERCQKDNSDFKEKERTIKQYIEEKIWENYEYIIYNDGTEEETLAQFIDIMKQKVHSY